MVIDIFELARTHGVIEGSLPLGQANRLRPELRDDAGALVFRIIGAIDPRGRPCASLRLRGELPLTCDRCARELKFAIDHEVDFYFVREASELEALPVTVEDEPEALLGSTHFDVEDLVEEEAILCLPVSPRHATCPESDRSSPAAARPTQRNPFATLPKLLREKGQ